MNVPTIAFTIAGRLENVSLVGAAVSGICKTTLTDTQAYQLELCLVEACNNVIEHAFHDDPEQHIDIAVAMVSDRMIFTLKYLGEPFSPVAPAAQFEVNPNDVDSLPEGGMGLFFINQLMDTIDYSHHDGTNTMTMTKITRKSEGAD